MRHNGDTGFKTGVAATLCFGLALIVVDGSGVVGERLLLASARAQGAGSGPAGNPGGAFGGGLGGTSGGVAAPRGLGAGGSGAGAGAGVGGSGESVGPGPVNQNRFGGGAGVTPPPDDTTPPGDTGTIVTNTILENVGGGAGGESYRFLDRCADYRGEKLSSQERISGRNLELINAAQAYLAPKFNPEKFRSATYLLANYQEEIDNGATDTLVAGSYLGLIAGFPVTQEVVGRVNAILCVTTRKEIASEIAEIAEQQRLATQQ